MKLVYNPARLQACADYVSMINIGVYKTAEDAKAAILRMMSSVRDTHRYRANENRNSIFTIATGGFVVLFSAERDGERRVEFLIDPYIAALSDYMHRDDNESITV